MSNIYQIDQQDPTLGEEVAFLQSALQDQRLISAQYKASMEAAVMSLESGSGNSKLRTNAALQILKSILSGEALVSYPAA